MSNNRKESLAVEEAVVKLGESENIAENPASWTVVVNTGVKEYLWFKLESTDGRERDFPITIRVKTKDALKLAATLCHSVGLLTDD